MNLRVTIALFAILSTICLAARAQDHLEPESGTYNTDDDDWNYAEHLRELLLKDSSPYYFARVICLPSFEAEWAVTLFQVDEGFLTPDDQLVFFVELTQAEKSIWDAEDYKKVAVKKYRVKLDGDTARAVREVWRLMLREVRYKKESRHVLDGTTYHFSRRVPLLDRGHPDKTGGFEEGHTSSPHEGSLLNELVLVGEDLKKFALAKPQDHDKIRSEIRNKVARLKARLDKAREP